MNAVLAYALAPTTPTGSGGSTTQETIFMLDPSKFLKTEDRIRYALWRDL
jgi:hypothetical protein